MEERLDDVEFLARSKNRVAVLDALSDFPHSRFSLQTDTGASRVTIGRIVTDLEARGWVRRTDEGYRATPTGRAVAAAFAELRETLDAAAVLEPIAASLPDDFLTIDIEHFSDAEVGIPTETDPLAAARIAAGLMDDCDHVRILAHAVTSETVANQIRATEERGQRSEVILSEATFESMLGDQTLGEQLGRLQEFDEATMYRYDGTIPVSMGIYDERTVGIGTVDDAAFPNAILVSSNEAVLEWARETFADLRDRSTPIRQEDLID